jgi:hypothetical protein
MASSLTIPYEWFDNLASFPPASTRPAGSRARAKDSRVIYTCVINDFDAHEWQADSQNLIPYDEFRITVLVPASQRLSGNVPTGVYRERYPILPLTSFSSNPSVSNPVLELDLTNGGIGPWTTLSYGTDYGLLPRTPQVTGSPGIGIGLGLASFPPSTGPDLSVADYAVGFAVSNAIGSTLGPSSVFRFTRTDRVMPIDPCGAKASQHEFSLPSEPAYTFRESTGSPLSNTMWGVWFPPIEGCQIEIWRRAPRGRGALYRAPSGPGTGLRRMSTGLTPFVRLPLGRFYCLMQDIQTQSSKIVTHRWRYFNPFTQSWSRLSQETFARAGTRNQNIPPNVLLQQRAIRVY